MAVLDSILNPLLAPLIAQGSLVAILSLALFISLIMTFAYKYLTDQTEMKRLKEEQKGFQVKMKEQRGNPEEMMKTQKEAMQVNMKYMKQSFRPTLITMIPLLLIFGWMADNLAYESLQPDVPYSITAAVTAVEEIELVTDENTEILSEKVEGNSKTWNLKSNLGTHFLTVKQGTDEQTKKVNIGDSQEPQTSYYKHSGIESISINYNDVKPFGSLSIFGWNPGWLGTYIIFSIIFSMVLRKGLKIY